MKTRKEKENALSGSFQAATILPGITDVIIVYMMVEVLWGCNSQGTVCDSPMPPASDCLQHVNGFFFPAITIKALLS